MAPPWVGVLLCTVLLTGLIVQQLLMRLKDYVRHTLKTANVKHRQAILDELDISSTSIDDEKKDKKPVIVGLFHPYW